MTIRPLLISMSTVVSLTMVSSFLAHAESLQEKIDGLWDATASVEIAPTPIGCQELRRRLAESQSYSQPYVSGNHRAAAQLLTDLAECETDESDGDGRAE